MPRHPSYLDFDIGTYSYKPGIDYRKHPELYQVGKGEQGALICQPYKNEIGPNWRFKNRDIASKSADIIYQQFLDYLQKGEFVGADMARKYLQMGYTRARRYANYKGGKKYDAEKDYAALPRGTGDPEKAAAANIFYGYWKRAEENERYAAEKKIWKQTYG